MLEGEVIGDNDEEEDQVGEKGAKMRGHPSWLGIGIINQSIGNLRQMVGGGSNPYGLVGILTPHRAVCTGFDASIPRCISTVMPPMRSVFVWS